MQNFEELESAIKNLKYYADQINKLSADQFDKDCDGHVAGDDTLSKRLELLGIIGRCAGEVAFQSEVMSISLNKAKDLTKELVTGEL
jgi:hypothetical protein